MAIEWMDNFSMYGTNSLFLLNGAYAEVQNLTDGNPFATRPSIVNDPEPTASGRVLRMGTAGSGNSDLPSANLIRKVLSGSFSTVGNGFRLWMENLPVSLNRGPIVRYSNTANESLAHVRVRPDGGIQVRRGSRSGTIIGETAGPVLVANAWQHIEIKLGIDSVAGFVEIRVDGVTVLNVTGVDTQGASGDIAQLTWYNFSPSSSGDSTFQMYIKDLVVWNTAGAYNNDFLGSVFVVNLVPDGDVALNWAPSTGSTGWNLLDNSPPLDATQYISADNTPPDAYVCTLTNLPPDITSVRGVMTVQRSRKIDGGDGNLQVSVISGSDEQAGADRPVTTAFTYWFDIFEEDPATGAPWTPTAVDAMNLKIDRTV
jgi:hypothetical protein